RDSGRQLHAAVRQRRRAGRDGRVGRGLHQHPLLGSRHDPPGGGAAAAAAGGSEGRTMIGVAMAAGGVAAGGLFWLAWQLFARTAALRPAMRRLQPAGVGARPAAARPWWWRWVGWLWRPPTRELALLGRTRRQYALSLGVSAVIGGTSIVVLSVAVAMAGIALPVVLPAGMVAGTAALGAWAAHHDILRRAGRTRHEFRRAVCSYLDMTALELAAGHGPVAALERACGQVEGPVFDRLRETLLNAQLRLHQPWE